MENIIISKTFEEEIKKAVKLLKQGGSGILDEPFNGFYVSFTSNDKQKISKVYSMKELDMDGEETVYVFCDRMLG